MQDYVVVFAQGLDYMAVLEQLVERVQLYNKIGFIAQGNIVITKNELGLYEMLQPVVRNKKHKKIRKI